MFKYGALSDSDRTLFCFRKMNFGHFACISVLYCLASGVGILAESSKGCVLSKNSTVAQKNLLKRLNPLDGQRFKVQNGSSMYTVAICGGVEDTADLASLTKTQVDSKAVQVLGRRNDTEILGGDGWLLLTYKSGDACNGTARASVHIGCPTNAGPGLWLLEETMCVSLLQLTAKGLCASAADEGPGSGTVFCIVFFSLVAVYLLGGVAYQRIKYNAQGVNQIPNLQFWRRLGELQADGCNYVCRPGLEREESWQRITNNFSEQDEPLLRP